MEQKRTGQDQGQQNPNTQDEKNQPNRKPGQQEREFGGGTGTDRETANDEGDKEGRQQRDRQQTDDSQRRDNQNNPDRESGDRNR